MFLLFRYNIYFFKSSGLLILLFKTAKNCYTQKLLSDDPKNPQPRMTMLTLKRVQEIFPYMEDIEYKIVEGEQVKMAVIIDGKKLAQEIFHRKRLEPNWIKRNASAEQMQEFVTKIEEYYKERGLLETVVGYKKFHKRKYAVLDSNGKLLKQNLYKTKVNGQQYYP